MWPFKSKFDFENIGIHMGNSYLTFEGKALTCKATPMYWMYACPKTGKFLIRGSRTWGELRGDLPEDVWENWKTTGFSPKQYLISLIPAKDQKKEKIMSDHQLELSTQELNYLYQLLNDNIQDGSYWGNKKNFIKMQKKLLEKIEDIIEEEISSGCED